MVSTSSEVNTESGVTLVNKAILARSSSGNSYSELLHAGINTQIKVSIHYFDYEDI
jgi:hypothetical protein